MTMIKDIQYALRLLAKKPGFTLLTTLVMAVGVGLSVFLFSMFNTMLFKDLPFKDSDRLVRFHITQDGVEASDGVDLHDYAEIASNLKGVELFGAYKEMNVNAIGRDGARRYRAAKTDPSIFQLSRTAPLFGREFNTQDNQQGAEAVVVIGYEVWRTQFGGDENIIDQTLRIDGKTHKVIGVMPQGYWFPDNTDLWLPLRLTPNAIARGKGDKLEAIALLQKNSAQDDINRQLDMIMQRIAVRHPETNKGLGVFINAFQRGAERDGIEVVYSMQIAAILILLLASINVGNLLYSRAIERNKETAIRVALGAPRGRLISQMLWESAIICSLGGLIGLLVMAWGLEVAAATVETFFTDKPAFWWHFGIDAFTLKIFFGFVLATILATGLLPAWKNSGADFNAALRDGTRGALGKKSGRLNRILVISEIFLSMTILIAAATMVVGAYRATFADFGVKSDNLLTARTLLREVQYQTPEQKIQFINALVAQLENSPGIGKVMIASMFPADWGWTPRIALEGKEYSQVQNNAYPKVNYIMVTPGTLAKLGVELKAGRYFDNSDEGVEKKSVIVTDSFAAAHFPNDSALGKRLRVVDAVGHADQLLTIIGVVNHTLYGDANNASGKMPTVFRPFSQTPKSDFTIAVEMKTDRATTVRTLRNAVAAIDPELPLFQIEDYATKKKRNGAPIRFISTIFMIFGLAAVVLAATGIYGVMSNTISQRTQEIGVKRALGAQDEQITRQFLWTGGKQLLWGGIPGAAAGCAMAFAMAHVIGIAAADLILVTTIMVSVVAGVVILATYLPTKRALQLEPGDALRYE
ncbi:ADOP family duplicated permease [Cellvibrio fibrivorans]|uniref:Permease n=1 Tax=Cellvibrio fibrivorans TaxID=126350 RepID=A0ABU1V1D6_9GAMM|nr:ADOP family duplicated permease [Cellvibrio fibrivorans]MDR7091256.1 putative permease [Cellvibrio fibrivorans]